MCGIIGWVDYKRNLLEFKPVIEKMTSMLVHRGPDESGTYADHHVLFGHRRLTVVDPEGGKQPMIKQYYDGENILIYNGELYNTEDLREILLARGHTFRSRSDTEVLLTAYLEWGVRCVEYLNGIYAFAIWNSTAKSLYMARDRLGVKPLFYLERANQIIFASEIKAILAHPEVEPYIDEQSVMQIFGLGPARPIDSGIFCEIHELPPACWHFYTSEHKIAHEYWKLQSYPHEENVDQTVNHISELFYNAVERQLVADVPVCTFLSGGLDSSAISSIAAQCFGQSGKGNLLTFSIDYEENRKHFVASDFQPDADFLWIDKVSGELGTVHQNITLTIDDLVTSLTDAVRANDLPGMADVDSSLWLFCKEVRKNAVVALSGECADEIFGGYPWFRKDEFINADTFPWSQAIPERKGLLHPAFANLPITEYVQSQYNDTLAKVPRLNGEDVKTHRMREISYLNLKWFMLTLLSRKDRMSMANSLEVRVPFADHRIVEYAWNIPLSVKYLKGREKGLLRRAFNGLLTEDVLWRKKSPYPKTHHPRYRDAVTLWLSQIIADPKSPLLNFIHKDRVEEIVNTKGKSFGKPWFGQLMTGPQLMAYLIQVNEWLRMYKVTIK